ncbi:MAG: chlorophyllide reductase subunit Y, partial [Pseudomonadota bacterium]
MTDELRYDSADEAEVITGVETTSGDLASAPGVDGMGCHAGAAEMEQAARAAGQSEILDQYARDYPQGPHDKPQSMCPAFGSLRVGLRMRR